MNSIHASRYYHVFITTMKISPIEEQVFESVNTNTKTNLGCYIVNIFKSIKILIKVLCEQTRVASKRIKIFFWIMFNIIWFWEYCY